MRCWINMFCHNDLHSNQKQPAQDGPCWLDSKVLKDQFGSTSTLPYITDMIQQFNDLPPFTSRFHLDLTPTTGHCYTNEMACVFYGPTLSAQAQSRWLIGTFRGGPNSNPTPGMPSKSRSLFCCTIDLWQLGWQVQYRIPEHWFRHSQAPTEVYAQSSNFWGCKNKVRGSNASVTGTKHSQTPVALTCCDCLFFYIHGFKYPTTHNRLAL